MARYLTTGDGSPVPGCPGPGDGNLPDTGSCEAAPPSGRTTTYTLHLRSVSFAPVTERGTVYVAPESTPPTAEGTPPTAHAGPDLTAGPEDTVTLQSRGSINPHGEWWRMAHLWTQPEGQNITLSNVTVGDPSFDVPLDAAGKTYTFTLTVTLSTAAIPPRPTRDRTWRPTRGSG